MQEKRSLSWLCPLIFTLLLFYTFSVYAQDSTFIKEQVEQINRVIAENSTSSNDPKATFLVDDTDNIITLIFERNKSLAGQNRGSFLMVATMLPNVLIQPVYLKTDGIINGQIIGAKFIEALQNDNCSMKVINQQLEFDVPVQSLTL